MLKIGKAAVLFSALCGAVWAQGDRGTLRGVVHDTSGAVVPGANVTVVNVATNTEYKTTSNSTGDFTAPELAAGVYRVRVESTGFKTLVQDSVTLLAGDTISLDLKLEIGTAQETVQVTSEAAQLQTDTARVATQISTKFVEELPLAVNGGVRSPFDLAGVTGDITNVATTVGGNPSMRVGGGKAGAFGMTLDGTSITVALSGGGNQNFVGNNTPSVEAIAEFAVDSSGFKAEFGHASGGSVSFVAKSGTNDLHGSLYEFLRNDVMDARGFFGTKPVLKQNDFGATIGGPVVIPKLYHGRNRTFFFYSYEGFRNAVGAKPTPYSVPSPEMMGGNFSHWVDAGGKVYTVYDPSTTTFNQSTGTYSRTAFPGNVIPVSRIDPVALSILNFAKNLAVPNVPNLVPGSSAFVRNNYISNGTTLSPNNKTSFKIDQVITSKQRISFYYGYGKLVGEIGPQGPAGLPAPLSGSTSYNRSGIYRGSYDYTISPSLLNRFYVGVNRFIQGAGSVSTLAGSPFTSDLLTTQSSGWQSRGICIPNYPNCNYSFPQINFSNEFTTWGAATTSGSESNIIEFRDDMTWIKGPHTFKWGGFYNNTLYIGFGDQNTAGNVTFSPLNTGVPGVTNQAQGGGSSFASFLLGQASAYSLDTPRFIGTHYRSLAGYFQDDWRVFNKLTLNLGVRVEASLAPLVDGDQQSELSFTLPNPAAGNLPGALIFAGTGTGRDGKRTLVPGWAGAAPRFGFSYSVNDKTTVRGSAGISFGPIVQAANSSHNLGFIQRITATSTSQGISPLFVLQQGAPYWAPVPDLDPSVGNGTNAPYWNGASATKPSNEYNFSFDIQRQLTGSLTLDAGYVGTMASDIQSTLLTFNALNYSALPSNLSPFTTSGRNILNSVVGSAAANSAGISAPFAGFGSLWGTGGSVAQALRPFPQYGNIDTMNGGGDRIAHSTYHALEVRATKRMSHGFVIQGSYVFSKILTDGDSTGPEDPLNRRLEKALSLQDQTHVAKFIYSVDLPFGKGKKYLNQNRIVSAVAGGWRLAGSDSYFSGLPIALASTVSFPIFAGPDRPTVPTYNGWGSSYTGNFDPGKSSFFQPVSFFGPQPTNQFGNATLTNPKLRNFPSLNENLSLARTFSIRERLRIEFRVESFNILNRVVFGPVSANSLSLQNANFGNWGAQANTPRQMQLTGKISW